LSHEELSDFICSTYDWNDPDAADFPVSMAMIDAEILRRAKRGKEKWCIETVLDDWNQREVPASVPELTNLLAWARRSNNRSI
jgi:hypothetical protein